MTDKWLTLNYSVLFQVAVNGETNTNKRSRKKRVILNFCDCEPISEDFNGAILGANVCNYDTVHELVITRKFWKIGVMHWMLINDLLQFSGHG